MTDIKLNPAALEAMSRVMRPADWRLIDQAGDDPLSVEDKEYVLAQAAMFATAYLAVAQPIVATVEELDALPDGSYVKGCDGFKHMKACAGAWILCVSESANIHGSGSIELPARVLHRPGVDDA